MNILYGIQTTGNGHSVRSKAMIQELCKRGTAVTTITPATIENWLSKSAPLPSH